MYSFQQTLRVSLFFIFGIGLIWLLKINLSGPSTIQGYRLEAIFDDVQQLSIGDEVRLAGVKIGYVENIQLTLDGQARVWVQIADQFQIPAASSASIMMTGLLGGHYLVIIPEPSTDFYQPNQTIHTKKAINFNTMMANFDDIAHDIKGALAHLSGKPGQPGLFENLNNLVVDNRSRIDHILMHMDEITASIHDGQGILGFLIQDHQAADDLKTTLNNLAQFSDQLNNGKSTLGRLVSDDSLYVHAQQVLNKADSALSAMTDSAPISALGVAATALF